LNITRRLFTVMLFSTIAMPGIADTKPAEIPWDNFFTALWQIESSSRINPPDGDNGNAIGPYQIWRGYWIDAKEYDPSLVANGETYESCRDKAYSEKVVRAYMSRYGNARRIGRTPTVQDLAAIHNGGPNGFKRIDSNENLKRYVRRFMTVYNNIEE